MTHDETTEWDILRGRIAQLESRVLTLDTGLARLLVERATPGGTTLVRGDPWATHFHELAKQYVELQSTIAREKARTLTCLETIDGFLAAWDRTSMSFDAAEQERALIACVRQLRDLSELAKPVPL